MPAWFTTVAPPTVQTDGWTTPVTVSGLSNGTPYHFTVAAINVAGIGRGSGPSGTVVPSGGNAPSNDNFVNTPQLSGSSGSVTGMNVGASVEVGEPQIGVGASVWYVWTSRNGGSVKFQTCSTSSTLNAVLGLFTGSSVNALSPRTVSTLQCQSGQTGTAVFFDVPSGQTLYIDVDGASTGSGPTQRTFTLQWAMQ